jgi:hypothetical protein
LKLLIPEFHVGTEKADKYICQLFKDLKIPVPPKGDRRKTVKITVGANVAEIDLEKEFQYIKKNGKGFALQMMLDQNDRFLNTPLSLGITGDDCGVKIKSTSEYGGYASTIEFPGIIEAPEISFSDDVEFFRHEAVRTFNDDDLSGFARSYRGFLQSSISLVDCFLHRYTFHVKHLVPSTKEYANTDALDSRRSIEERLEAWITTFAPHKMEEYIGSKQRSKFIELKSQRNCIVHPSNPSIPYGVKQAVRYLNYAQDGIGGLLSELRSYTGYSENIGFIRQVKTLPVISVRKNA